MSLTIKQVIARLKSLSNLDRCESAEDMQSSLEAIAECLNAKFPSIPEESALDDSDQDDGDDEIRI
jgi:hypothetical protein